MIRTSHLRHLSRLAAALALAAAVTACSVGDQSAPTLTGPSGPALSLTMTATPDQLPRDGVSQSEVAIRALDPNNQPVVGLGLTVEVSPTGAVLSESSIRTDANGVATISVTALPASSLGNTITVVMQPVGTNTANGRPRTVSIAMLGPDNATEPTPQFTTNPTTPTEVDTITFDASSTIDEGQFCNDDCTYAWSFGDGTTASGRVVTHNYGAPGVFSVTLTVTDAAGTVASTTEPLVVADVAPPTVSFSASPTAPTAGQSATFTATASPAPNHFIMTYSWAWGDGSSSQSSNPSIVKTFSTAGTYNVTLTVTDDLGQTASATSAVTVANPLTADFTFSPTNPTTATAVNFNGTPSASANGNAISTYAWDFGDGSTANGSSATASHTFGTAATYVVRLTITDSAGNTATATKNVTVATP